MANGHGDSDIDAHRPSAEQQYHIEYRGNRFAECDGGGTRLWHIGIQQRIACWWYGGRRDIMVVGQRGGGEVNIRSMGTLSDGADDGMAGELADGIVDSRCSSCEQCVAEQCSGDIVDEGDIDRIGGRHSGLQRCILCWRYGGGCDVVGIGQRSCHEDDGRDLDALSGGGDDGLASEYADGVSDARCCVPKQRNCK